MIRELPDGDVLLTLPEDLIAAWQIKEGDELGGEAISSQLLKLHETREPWRSTTLYLPQLPPAA